MNKLFTVLLVCISSIAFCQSGGISVSPNGTAPDPSAALDINYTTKGLLIPRVTQQQRDAINSPALGLEIFNTTNNCYEGYGFGNWQSIACLCTGAPSAPSAITGNSTPCLNGTSNIYSVGFVLGVNSYSWTVPSDATIIAGQGSNSITVNFGSNAGNIGVTANNSCGSSSVTNLPVTLSTAPSTPGAISGTTSVCANAAGNVYTISAVDGATGYNWTVPSGATITANTGTSITVTFGANPAGNITVAATNACGTSAASSQTISANPATPATPGTISGNTSATTNSTGNVYSISAINNATTYTWSVPSDATITNGQGTTSITVTFGTNSGNISVTAGNSCGTSAANSLAVTLSCYSAGNHTFSYTGGQQTFTVPACVTSVTISAYGAQGGSSSPNAGGMGGNNTATFTVTPGQALYVYVGGAGGNTNNNGGAGGYNGGGTGTNYGAGGGGASDVRSGGTDLASRIIVAGGGGGCTVSAWTTTGGAGGGTNGGDGISNVGANWCGKGATQSGGGTPAVYSGSAGSLGQGGNGGGPGGGGGYYGGGGADAGGGGGGSGYVSPSGSSVSYSSGVRTGDGQVVITW